MGKPIVCINPSCTITFGSTILDISDHLRTVTPNSEVEVIENRTFAAPKQRDFGNQTDDFTLGLGWSGDLHAALLPFVGIAGQLVCKPVGAVNKAYRATVRFGAMPYGEVAHGATVETELPLIVDGDISYS